ncbi:Superfamily I DNA and/or RNA helicase [Chitinophaga jiangningensis]|uniref:Superfamily I DNA and/or RNA helicase n=1 Tax=Chitinophaga jiangningensis TaxID=1419482 RepID=A0A1M7EDF9_9BACT|nr:AAA domain-containing protein [Chitinophaga jiangningensis]SHL89666.1 Superfamily I DNA and/or RNA helicase [Chitinophaga jiangningensis]
MGASQKAAAFFARIQEAANTPQPNDKLRLYKLILESLFRDLTRQEHRSFGNLFARMQFYFDKEIVPADIQQQLTALRILTSRATRTIFPLQGEEHTLCIKALAESVAWFYSAVVPLRLSETYYDAGDKSLSRNIRNRPASIISLKCMVTAVGPLVTNQQGKYSCVLLAKNDEQGDFELSLDGLDSIAVMALHAQLRPYDSLHVIHCRQEETEEHQTPFYTTTAESQLVLEPDLLIDISDLAECFNHKGVNKLLYLVKKLVPQTSSPAAFKGNLVNALLDEMLRNKAIDFKTSFKEAVADNVLQAAAYGRDKINEMFRDIRQSHWANLHQTVADLQNKPVRIEPTFFSCNYGIQGRLDIMAEDDTDPNRKEIFELKSGKAPDFNTWKNHEMQVVGYNLLLRSAFGRKRKGSSAILYSGAQAQPLRNVSSTHAGENALLQLRNEVVAMLLRLAAGEYDILSTINSTAAAGLPSFSMEPFMGFEKAWNEAPDITKTYYKTFLSFILREFLQAKCGMFSEVHREDDADGFAALWLQQEEEKADRFNIIPGLQFREFDSNSSSVTFDIVTTVSHNFRVGDTAIIYARTGAELKPLQQELLKGRIEELGRDHLVFSLNNRQMTLDFFRQHDEWIIEHDIYESNYWIAASALFYMLAPQYRNKAETLLGLRAPRTRELEIPLPPMFNRNQEEIVRNAIQAEDYYLLQGPPGTGKTSAMLTTIADELVKRNNHVVIVAFTNKAVEEICGKLDAKDISYLRMGGRNTASAVQLKELCMNGSLDDAKQFITSHRIFVGTVATMATRLDLLITMGIPMDVLIADEASQLTEPQLLGLLMPFRKFILIGDQNQLPPVVAQESFFCETTNEDLRQIGIADLRCSIFERLMQQCKQNNWLHAWGMLNTHFRMHDSIASMVNPYYAGQLTSGRIEQQEAFTRNAGNSQWDRLLSLGRKVFIPSPFEPTSKMNSTEAARVVDLLRYLRQQYGPAFTKDTVGVVTPWRTQISLIRELIADDKELQAVNIDTVERFQGSENDIIIVSLAVYHTGQVHTLQCIGRFQWEGEQIEVDRKLLVTLSRARKQVIMMGYEPVLQESAHYRRVLGEMVRVEAG